MKRRKRPSPEATTKTLYPGLHPAAEVSVNLGDGVVAKYKLPHGPSINLSTMIDRLGRAERRLRDARAAAALMDEVVKESERRHFDCAEAVADQCVEEGGVPA